MKKLTRYALILAIVALFLGACNSTTNPETNQTTVLIDGNEVSPDASMYLTEGFHQIDVSSDQAVNVIITEVIYYVGGDHDRKGVNLASNHVVYPFGVVSDLSRTYFEIVVEYENGQRELILLSIYPEL